MEAQTPFIIILTSIITGTFTVFLSNFLAPRINAWYEQKYRDGLVYKKTLRILLEIEIHVQRNLKHPTIDYLCESVIPKLTELVGEPAASLSGALPQIIQFFQPRVVKMLPDKSEALDKEFTLVLNELSTVDPLLAYQISERHSISPIQQMNTVWIDLLRGVGVEIKEEDKEVQLISRFAESLKAKMINELLSDLRKDILKVAARAGKKDLKEIKLHFREQDNRRREDAQNIAEDFAKFIASMKTPDAKESENHSKEEIPAKPTTSPVTQT